VEDDVEDDVAAPSRSSAFSMFAGAIGSVTDAAGVRAMIGVGYQPIARLRLGLDAIVGSGPGLAPRATIYLTTGALRPTINLGVPLRRLERLDNPMDRPCAIAGVDGTPRTSGFAVAAHGGIGLEWRALDRWSAVAELGYERYSGVDECITERAVLTPMAGIIGRL
jgi:hypothetical protein